MDPALNGLADTADAEQLASELCSWPSSIGMQPSDDVIERLRSLQEAVALEARLQEFVHGLMVQQHGKVSLEDLIGQQRFPVISCPTQESHTNVCYRTMTQTLPFGRSGSATILALGALITCCGSLIRMCALVSRRCLACISVNSYSRNLERRYDELYL